MNIWIPESQEFCFDVWEELMDVSSVDCEIRKAIILLYVFVLCISKTVYVCVYSVFNIFEP